MAESLTTNRTSWCSHRLIYPQLISGLSEWFFLRLQICPKERNCRIFKYQNLMQTAGCQISNQVKRMSFQRAWFYSHFPEMAGQYCNGIQIHVTVLRFLSGAHNCGCSQAVLNDNSDEFMFKDPPYEYKTTKMPFDILSGQHFTNLLLDNKPLAKSRLNGIDYKPILTF